MATKPASASTPTQAGDLVNLAAVADSPLTEISVFNGRFESIGAGLGRFEQALPPGHYVVRFVVGTLINERYLTLSAGATADPIRIGPDDMKFPSAAPLDGTATADPSQGGFAASISRARPKRIGRGGSLLLLFVRGPSPTPDPALPHIAAGLTLRDLDGKLLFDLGKATDGHAQYNCAGANLSVPPSIYRLRAEGCTGLVTEQAIVTHRDWQTQVFLQRKRLPSSEDDLAVAIARASILMAKRRDGFQPDHAASRWTEVAREALTERRDLLATPGADVKSLVESAPDNPMLGLLLAQMFLFHTPIDRSMLRTLADKLHSVLGAHPDLLALNAWLDSASPSAPHTAPPMLAGSWQALVRVSAEPNRAGIIPVSSLAGRVADQIISVGPWLVWRHDKTLDTAATAVELEAEANASELDLASLLRTAPEHIAAWLPDSAMTSPQDVDSFVEQNALDPTEAELLGYLAQLKGRIMAESSKPHSGPNSPSTSSVKQTADTLLNNEALVQFLMMPASIIGVASQALMTKIKAGAKARSQEQPSTWPPTDGREFIHGEAFGQVVLDVTSAFINRYSGMDFTDAVSQVFAWFDAKLKADPHFLDSGKFRTWNAFVAYLKQAIWNAARLSERKRNRHERREQSGLFPLDQPVEAHDPTPEEAAALTERLDALPEPEKTVVEKLLFEQTSLADVAQSMGRTEAEVADLFDRATKLIADGLETAPPLTRPKRPRPRRGKKSC